MKHVKISEAENIVYAELNRPEKHNAFHPEMIAELTQVFLTARTKPGLRALVLSGAGKSFCSGGDLDWMKSMVQFSFDENVKDSEALFDMFEAGRTCPVPIIGRVHGSAMGGGLGLVAICDLVAAETQTKFCFTEVKWGLAPAVISPFVLRKTQVHRAREWMMTARLFSAADAAAAGLVHFVGNLEQVDRYVEQTVTELLNLSPEGVRETKRLLEFLEGHSWSSYKKECARTIAERRASLEGQHGLKAFLEKRDPAWRKGQEHG